MAAAVACMLAALPGRAQNFPVKPVRIVVPFAPGGTSDILARLIGVRITEATGQQVVVDNRPGASGTIGAEIVSRAPPDGHTLVLMDLGGLVMAPHLIKLNFDTVRDLTAVTIVSYSPHILCVHPSVPAATLAQLVALAKQRKGALNYASAGPASAPHLAGVLFASRTGIDWTYIPFKGGAQAILDVASGHTDVLFNGMLATYPFVANGKLKLIAVSSEKRMPTIPNVPTVAETIPGFVTGSWQGLFGPANMAPALAERIHAEFDKVLRLQDTRDKLATQGTEPLSTSPAKTAEFLRSERDRWGKVIKDAGITM
jgi:tripartite-type tricarboxylate transporter receptor subunit TctC